MLGPPRAPIRYWPWKHCVCGKCMGNVVCNLAQRQRPGWGLNPVPMRLLRPDIWDPARGDPHAMIATRGRPRWGMPAHVPETFYSPINGIMGRNMPYPSPQYSHAPELQKKCMDKNLSGFGQYEPEADAVMPKSVKELAAKTLDVKKLSEFVGKNAGPVIIGMLIGSYICKQGRR